MKNSSLTALLLPDFCPNYCRGKLFVALVTFGRWSAAKTTVAQLAAKAAQLDEPVDITPEALQQRMMAWAV